MADSEIGRQFDQVTLAVTASDSTTGIIDYAPWAGGMVHVPNGSSITTLTWWSSHDGVTFEAAYDTAGEALATTVAANQSHPIPTALFGSRQIKAVGNAAGTVYVSLKG